jgi:hypothetical protein
LYNGVALGSCPGARNVSVAVCAADADGELGPGAGDDVPAAGAEALLAGVEVGTEVLLAGVEAGAAAGELLDDPHAVASNARHAIAPAAASRRDLGA